MIRPATHEDFQSICEIINDAATAYKGVIPDDCWHEPYMSSAELKEQIEDGVTFYCYEADGALLGVMGIQDRTEVYLIRHAYVRTDRRNRGIGGKLLAHLCRDLNTPVLIGTWKAADWAIAFYQRYGFRLLEEKEKDRLLMTYWKISDRQRETSVVLASTLYESDRPR